MVHNPNYVPANEIYQYKYSMEMNAKIEDLASFSNAVMQTIIGYISSHFSSSSRMRFSLSFDEMGMSKIDHSGQDWDRVIASMLEVLIDMLNDNPNVYMLSVSWSIHLAHLAGANGIQFDYGKTGNTTGSILVDHGKPYGITYELIDRISNGSIDSVFPDSMAYID